jgi:hypothetical protein
MFGSRTVRYEALRADELSSTKGISSPRWERTALIVKTVLILEIINLLLLLSVYSAVFGWRPLSRKHALDTCM